MHIQTRILIFHAVNDSNTTSTDTHTLAENFPNVSVHSETAPGFGTGEIDSLIR